MNQNCSPSTAPKPLLDLLNRPNLTDLCFNQFSEVYFDEGKGMSKYSGPALFRSDAEYRAFVLENISLSGKTWDAKLPFVDTVFFQTHRAHIAFPPLAQFGIYLSLRKLPSREGRSKLTAQLEATTRWKDSEASFELLKQSISAHETIIFAGGTGSGKTTLLNDLLTFAEDGERMIALEDTSEIHPAHPHFLSLLSRPANADGFGAVSLKDLIRQTLRMRPDRILIGECRGDEVLDLLQALNTGHQGTLATVHANSARDALKRLELLALIAARGSISSGLIKELITNGVQKIVYLKRESGVRKIHSILAIQGMEREVILTRDLTRVMFANA
jgi:pilus assembly protein CpaF